MRNLLRIGALLCLGACPGWAVDWKALKPQGYVSDYAGVVDAASRQQLDAYGAIVERSTGVQMAFVTLQSLEGEPIEDVANTIYRSFGVGQKGKNEGVLLLLSIGDRRSRIEVGYGLEPILPDGFVGSILREMRPALRERQYGEAMMAGAQQMGSTIAKAKGVTLNARLPRRRPARTSDSIPWPVVVGGIALLFFLFRSRGTGGYGGGGGGFLPGLILGGMARSTWGSRGSGGFGGSDSSDGGFGGFGGGDSGGGGASSDW